LRAPFYVSENKNLDELILEFQSKRIHLAIVVDQKNKKTVGVVSLEDVVEEIVGDISDEFDGDKND
jgi:CBS domain containing-hemolysin-like protein